MNHLAGAADGATPLDSEEAEQLIPSWVVTRADLDAAEQDNIARAIQWSTTRRLNSGDILQDGFLHALHRRMFGDVWKWAGSYRTSAKNLGVDFWTIGQEVAIAIADAAYWVEHGVYDRDEAAVRLHHRLVAIHPFPNGNGRHARQVADLLVVSLGGVRFTWGRQLQADPAAARLEYLNALRAADKGDFGLLIAFARS